MESVLSKEIQDGLDAARLQGLRAASRLRVGVAGQTFAVLRMQDNGFTVAAADAPNLRGRVDLFDGAAHLFQCLIVASAEEAGEMRYEFKRATPIATRPALDFEQAEYVPAGLITDAR